MNWRHSGQSLATTASVRHTIWQPRKGCGAASCVPCGGATGSKFAGCKRHFSESVTRL
jgi:hypothetical protein